MHKLCAACESYDAACFTILNNLVIVIVITAAAQWYLVNHAIKQVNIQSSKTMRQPKVDKQFQKGASLML